MFIRRFLAPLLAATFLLSSAQTVALAAPPAPSPSTPSADSQTSAPTDLSVDQLEKDVADLSARAQELTDALEKGAQDYEDSKRALGDARRAATAAAQESQVAQAAAAQAKDEMGQFARNSYMNPVPQSAALLSAVSGGSPTDAVRGAQYLDRIGRDTSATVVEAQQLKDEAAAASRRAVLLRESAEQKSAQLALELEQLRKDAAAASEELTTRMDQLFIARSLAAVNSGNPDVFLDSAAMAAACASTTLLPPPESQAWGGFSNGLIPVQALCSIAPGHYLRFDAAVAYRALSAAYQEHFGEPICITDSYRSYASQVRLFSEKPGLAATPGKSNHGWGLAVDLCGGIQSYGTPQYEWMMANAPSFGWYNPKWAQQGGSGASEPWHWNFGTFD